MSQTTIQTNTGIIVQRETSQAKRNTTDREKVKAGPEYSNPKKYTLVKIGGQATINVFIKAFDLKIAVIKKFYQKSSILLISHTFWMFAYPMALHLKLGCTTYVSKKKKRLKQCNA